MRRSAEDASLKVIRSALGVLDDESRARVLARLRDFVCMRCGRELVIGEVCCEEPGAEPDPSPLPGPPGAAVP